MFRQRPFAILIVLALLGACTTSGTPQPQAPTASTAPGTASAGAASPATGGGGGSVPADVCALLTAGELQSATGKAYGAGKSVPVTGGLGCEWDISGGMVSVSVYALDHDQFVFNRDHLQGQPVAGVGDEAWAGGPGPELFVAKGTLEIAVGLFGLSGDKTVAAETALAKLVVSRV